MKGSLSLVPPKDYTAESISATIFCLLDKMKINETPEKLIVQA